MEERKITIISQNKQSRKDIMSAATTLGELKSDLDNVGIDYADMTFLEGYSKTELKSDESILPTNVPTKNGTTTNELVFLLTTPQKKIRSGLLIVSRGDCYSFFKNHPEKVVEFRNSLGKSYTNATTEDLLSFVKRVLEVSTSASKEEAQHSCECSNLLKKVQETIQSLYKNNEMSTYAKEVLYGVLGVKDEDSSKLTDEEIDDMFDFVD